MWAENIQCGTWYPSTSRTRYSYLRNRIPDIPIQFAKHALFISFELWQMYTHNLLLVAVQQRPQLIAVWAGLVCPGSAPLYQNPRWCNVKHELQDWTTGSKRLGVSEPKPFACTSAAETWLQLWRDLDPYVFYVTLINKCDFVQTSHRPAR